LYDALGRLIETVVSEELSPGTYEVQLDGSKLPSGVYFYNLSSGSHSLTKKLMLIK
jgi:hypothetical protein